MAIALDALTTDRLMAVAQSWTDPALMGRWLDELSRELLAELGQTDPAPEQLAEAFVRIVTGMGTTTLPDNAGWFLFAIGMTVLPEACGLSTDRERLHRALTRQLVERGWIS